MLVLLFVRLFFRLFLRFCVLSFIFVFLFKANETQELEELKKTKEQTEARLNIQISSLNENLTAARTEAEKFQQQTREAGAKLSEAEKRNDDLKGEIAGNVISILSSSINCVKLQPWTNCVGKCLKTSNHDQKPTKTTSCTLFPLSMLENSKIQTSVTRKVLSQHCTGVGRGKMRGEHLWPRL